MDLGLGTRLGAAEQLWCDRTWGQGISYVFSCVFPGAAFSFVNI